MLAVKTAKVPLSGEHAMPDCAFDRTCTGICSPLDGCARMLSPRTARSATAIILQTVMSGHPLRWSPRSLWATSSHRPLIRSLGREQRGGMSRVVIRAPIGRRARRLPPTETTAVPLPAPVAEETPCYARARQYAPRQEHEPSLSTGDSGVVRMSMATKSSAAAVNRNHRRITPSNTH